jgi:exo-beta-1,3-glucanase (GH17 family)
MAAKHDIAVTIGAWLNHDRAANEREVESAIRLAHLNRNVSRVIVGNEVRCAATWRSRTSWPRSSACGGRQAAGQHR